MKLTTLLTCIFFLMTIDAFAQEPTGAEILKKIDKNLVLDRAISFSTMIIHGRTGTRTVKSESWIQGRNKAFVEYTDPPREKGKKMLKLDGQVWLYFPEPADRIITVSGHMLRQPVMGSDLSYEDITENRGLSEMYDAVVAGSEKVDGRNCYVLNLTGKTDDISYYRRKLWVDKERWIPLMEERFAKSGRPLKRSRLVDFFTIEGRWFPKKILYNDLMQNGDGTEYTVDSLKLHADIGESRFTKAALKK